VSKLHRFNTKEKAKKSKRAAASIKALSLNADYKSVKWNILAALKR
jgi:hypothetical protein